MTSDNDPIYLNIPQNEESNKKGFLKHEERRNKNSRFGSMIRALDVTNVLSALEHSER